MRNSTLERKDLRMIAPILSVVMFGVSIFGSSAGSTKEADFITQFHAMTEQHGVTFAGEYTGEIFGNLSGGIQQGASYEGLLKLTLQLDLKKILDWDGASIYASALYPHGNGLSSQYTGDFNLLSSIDASDSVRLFELWFQQKFFESVDSNRANVSRRGILSIRVGKHFCQQLFWHFSHHQHGNKPSDLSVRRTGRADRLLPQFQHVPPRCDL
jgi:carbohydrate-selective porin OprB